MSTFTSKPTLPAAGNGRYSLGASAPTEEGEVAIGVDRNSRAFLVHTVGRTSENIALHAVASAIGGGKVIAFADLVAAIDECGKLGDLQKAIEKAQA